MSFVKLFNNFVDFTEVFIQFWPQNVNHCVNGVIYQNF